MTFTDLYYSLLNINIDIALRKPNSMNKRQCTLLLTIIFTFAVTFVAVSLDGALASGPWGTLLQNNLQSHRVMKVAPFPFGSTIQAPLTLTYESCLPGELDHSFGTNGIVITNVAGITDVPRAAALQSDGKFVVTGYSSFGGLNLDFSTIRYDPDGSLDMTFGSGGKVVTDFNNSIDEAYSVAVQSDGKIVVAGRSGTGFAMVRYNPDGSLDTSFGSANSGKVVTPVGISAARAYSLATQPDGKLVLGGYAPGTGSSSDFAIVRYNADGSLDPSFGAGGKVMTDFVTLQDEVRTVLIQSDSKIVATGFSGSESGVRFGIARYNTNGSLDTSFGTDGKVVTQIGDFSQATSASLQSDGRLVVVGSSFPNFALARYNPSGSLDASFGNGGIVTTVIGSGIAVARSVAIQSDGKIVAVGNAMTDANANFAVVRYHSDGALDTTFDTDGKVITAIGNGSSFAISVFIQTDNKIVAVGGSQNGSDGDFAVARYFGTACTLPPTPTTTPTPPPPVERTNHALAANGGTAAGTTELNPASNAIDGSRVWAIDSAWKDNDPGIFPDTLQITFNGPKSIDEISIFAVRDDFLNTTPPEETTMTTLYSLVDFEVQNWTGSEWATVPGGLVTGNDKAWVKLTFPPVDTTAIRVIVNSASQDGYTRIVELEAWGDVPVPSPSPTPAVEPSPTATVEPSPTPTVEPDPSPTQMPMLRKNHALSANGATAVGSTELNPASNAIDGSRVWANGGAWKDSTPGDFPDFLGVSFNGTKTIDEVSVFAVLDDYLTTTPPDSTTSTSMYSLVAFEVQYWDGVVWTPVPGGTVMGNNKAWVKITFPAVSTTGFRVVVNNAAVDGYSRIVELEAWGDVPVPQPSPTPIVRMNHSLTANGGVASGSTEVNSASNAIDGSRVWAVGGAWKDSSPGLFPDVLTVTFNGTKTIDEISIFAVRDDFNNTTPPDMTTTTTQYSLIDFEVQYWDGSNWLTVPGGLVTGNNLAWVKLTFAPISTSRIRVLVNNAAVDGYSRIVELEAWGTYAEVDANTLLSLRFENTLIGELGEVPVTSPSMAFLPGVVGQSANFLAGSQLSYQSANNINSKEGTVEFWIKPNWNGTVNPPRTILNWNGTDYGGMTIDVAFGDLSLIMNKFVANRAVQLDVRDWKAGEWHYVAVTYSNTTKVQQIYVDGVLRKQSTFTDELPTINNPNFKMGISIFYPDTPLDAQLDEFRISNRVRTSVEIAARYLGHLD